MTNDLKDSAELDRMSLDELVVEMRRVTAMLVANRGGLYPEDEQAHPHLARACREHGALAADVTLSRDGRPWSQRALSALERFLCSAGA